MTPTFDDLRPKMDRWQRTFGIVGVLALIALAIGFFSGNRAEAMQSYLWAWLFWGGISISCLGISLLHNVVGGNWGVVIRRFLEAGMRTLLITVIGVIPILIAIPLLYAWKDPAVVAASSEVAFKTKYYLNTPFFIVRTVFYFALWGFLAWRLLRMSAEQDNTGDPGRTIQNRMKRLSAPGLVFFMFSTSWAWIDWIQSLEPAWYSTMHPWIFTIGQTLLTFSFVIAVLILFSKTKPFSDVLSSQHFHDLGNLLLCFTMVWTYMSISQFIIIWHENLPDEIPWYIRRFSNGWGYLAFFISIFHFFVPFFLLLMRFIKKNPNYLFRVAIWLVIVRCLDVFWFVVPAWRQRYFSIAWTDFAAILALGGIWLYLFIWRLKQRPLLPMHDPRLGFHSLEAEA
ncbi:MAG: hypothetical protein ABSH09_28405 [Bryobacteraceae bacterium]|jgi:hypothetical protein